MRQTLFMIDQYLFDDHWILAGWLLLAAGYRFYSCYGGTGRTKPGSLGPNQSRTSFAWGIGRRKAWQNENDGKPRISSDVIRGSSAAIA